MAPKVTNARPIRQRSVKNKKGDNDNDDPNMPRMLCEFQNKDAEFHKIDEEVGMFSLDDIVESDDPTM